MSQGKLWGGRFSHSAADAMEALSRSVHFDWRLAPYDLRGSVAHANILQSAGLLTKQEADVIIAELRSMISQYESGELLPALADEDVHGALERILVERLGEVGGKLRAGRSRNDQVATDLRLFLRDAVAELILQLTDLVDAFIAQGERNVEVAAPGFTHLQHAQPVSLGHELIKHAHALLRDIDRLQDWDKRTAFSPLGAGALAGSALALDPIRSAAELGFTGAVANSIDAVSDRDFAAEASFIFALIGVHLSRIGEEWCLYASKEFGWINLADEYSTGSSIMPQKKNPDVAELARGKCGRLIGNVVSILTMLKGLPFAYNRDLQEDKEPLFDSIDTLMLLLPALTGMVATSTFNIEQITKSAPAGFSLATEIADWLVVRGMAFRSAHEVAGACVRECEALKIELHELSDHQLQAIHTMLTPAVRAVLQVEGAIAGRSRFGGTAPSAVRNQISQLKSDSSRTRTWAAEKLAASH